MFKAITLRGKRGEINYGWRLAASLSSWVVSRNGETQQWALSAYVERADTFQLSRRPLQFTAPRYDKPPGIWCFEIKSLDIKGDRLSASISPPMHGR